MTANRVTAHVQLAMTYLVAFGLIAGVGSVGSRAPEPSPVAHLVGGTGIVTTVHVPAVKPALVGFAAGVPVEYEAAYDIDTAAQMEKWTSEYGLDDQYLAGELPIQVADQVFVDGVEVCGVHSGGDILVATGDCFSAFVTAHEVAHWIQYRNASFIALGSKVLPNVEKSADCMAMVMLAGTVDEERKVTDCTAADIATAVLLLHDDVLPLVSDEDVETDEVAAASGASRYAGDDVDPYNSYPSELALRAARARAGVTPHGAQWNKDVLDGGITLSLEAARVGGTPDTDWAAVGVQVIDFPLLRQAWGSDLLFVDGVVVVDAARMASDTYGADRAIGTHLMVETVPGWNDLPDLGACWTTAITYAARGWAFGRDADGDVVRGTPDEMDLPDCTREVLLASAQLWVDAGLEVQTPVAPTDEAVELFDADGSRTGVRMPAETNIRVQRRATERDWTDALAAAGLPYAYGTWVPLTN